jgi:uncharacterized protein
MEPIYLKVHIQARAKKTAIVGQYGDKLKIKVAASPFDNQANEELIAFIAQLYKVPKKNVQLVRGQKSRDKLLMINKGSRSNI